eukprot:356484-Hanusia_phi.AAC.2
MEAATEVSSESCIAAECRNDFVTGGGAGNGYLAVRVYSLKVGHDRTGPGGARGVGARRSIEDVTGVLVVMEDNPVVAVRSSEPEHC